MSTSTNDTALNLLNAANLLHSAFQSDLSALWAQEEAYRRLLEKGDQTRAQLQFSRQGYSLPKDLSRDRILCIADDYTRLGRPEIATHFRNLSNELLHEEIFKIAHDKYTRTLDIQTQDTQNKYIRTQDIQTEDIDYGILLSICYDCGYGTEVNKEKALQIDHSLMKRGSVLALCSVANAYLSGAFLSKDIKKYHEYYAKALEQNEFFTPHTVWGQRLLFGYKGVEQNIEQGIALLQVAATNRQSTASWVLSEYYRSLVLLRTSMEEDDILLDLERKTYEYAKIAADQKSPLGLYSLATCYDEGMGVEENIPQYLANLQKSASIGCATASIKLAQCYINGTDDIPIDYVQGLTFAFQAIRQDLVTFKEFAQFFLGRKQDPEFMEIAYKLCLQCLEGHLLDNPKDTAVMGALYQKGLIVPQNIEMAIALFRKAAKQGDSDAADALALLCTGNKDTAPILSLTPSLAAELKGLVSYDVLISLNATANHITALYETICKDWKWSDWKWLEEGETQAKKEIILMPTAICQLVAHYAYEGIKSKSECAL